MNIDKLKEIGLTPMQIDQVMNEYNRHSTISNEALEAQQKRNDIMAIKDDAIRQQLIMENAELFQK